MRVFVTGATGFLGSHLMEKLVGEGVSVTALYRSEERLKDLLEDLPSVASSNLVNWVKGDLFSKGWSLKNCDVVYHLAGYVGYTEKERPLMEKVNVEGTRRLLNKVVDENKNIKFILLSSVVSVGAGLNKNEVLDEDSKFNLSDFNFGYSETKRKAEKLCFEMSKKHEFFALSLNPSTIYGKRDMLKGSRKAQLKAARGKQWVCPRGGVSLVSVQDVCDALWKAVSLGKTGERYILSGDNITIKELLNEIAHQSGAKGPRLVLSKSILLGLGFLGFLLSKIGIQTSLSLEKMRVVGLYHWFKNDKAKKHLSFQATGHKETISESLSWAKEKGLI